MTFCIVISAIASILLGGMTLQAMHEVWKESSPAEHKEDAKQAIPVSIMAVTCIVCGLITLVCLL